MVLPIEMRRVMNIGVRDAVEIFTDGESIILKKYQPSCVFCNSMDDISTYMGYNVCRSCMEKLGRQARED